MKSELQVKVNQKLGIIDFNYEEMKQKLSEKMEEYNDIVVTADTRTIAKKDVASLRKIKKALNDRRIEVKKEYMAPYDEFDSKVKELTALIDEPIELINKQVKVFEEKEKQEKKKEIEKLYSELIGDNEEYLPLKKIYNKRWENVSFSIKEIEKEIKESVDGVDLAVTTIKGMKSEVEEKALELFKGDLSLASAITYINKHEQIKAEIIAKQKAEEERKQREEEERRKRLEEERIREQERQRLAEEERIRGEERKKFEEKKTKEKQDDLVIEELPSIGDPGPYISDLPDLDLPDLEEKETYLLRIEATESEFLQIVEFIESLGLKGDVMNEV